MAFKNNNVNLVHQFLIWGLVTLGIVFLASRSKTENQYKQPTAPISQRETHEQVVDESNFHGYECTGDCSGHEAGYNWAEEHNISDEDDCNSSSNSFNEGCKAYVEENSNTNSDSE